LAAGSPLKAGFANPCQAQLPQRLCLQQLYFYRYRNLVARCFGKGKNARGSSTRYNKRSDTLPDAIKLF
jgi:transposase